MIRAGRVDELDVVVRERDLRRRTQLDAVVVRMQPDRRMRGRREPVPVTPTGCSPRRRAGARARARRSCPARSPSGIRTSRYACTMMPASVNARVTRATCSTVTPFFMSSSSRSDATSSPPLTATQPESASSAQSSGVNVFSKRMLPHHVIASFSAMSRFASARSPAGGAASSTRWKPVSPVSSISARIRLHDDVGGRPVVAADVVERHVAERALLPVAAVRERDLVPAAVGPEPVHRVEHLEHRDVVDREAGRRTSGCRCRGSGCRAASHRSRARPRRARRTKVRNERRAACPRAASADSSSGRSPSSSVT